MLSPHIIEAFRQAIGAADARVGATAPNPPVGCTVLSAHGEILAVAAHPGAGAPHAEPLALQRCRELGVLERAHTLAVTLEPCNHQGRTPPCTGAILKAGIKRVWIGAVDPNPKVAGGGVAALRAGGLEVEELPHDMSPAGGGLARGCAELIRPFGKWVRTGRPWVVVKRALDAQGSMIPPPGRKTFTSEASLRLAHELRKRADGVLTGIGTVLADAPEFTVRRVSDHPDRRRLLIIMDRQGRTPCAYRQAAAARGFEVHTAGELEQALERAGRAGALSLLVEAGPRVSAAVLEQRLWDECVTIRKADEPGASDRVERGFAAA